MNSRLFARLCLPLSVLLPAASALAQPPEIREGAAVPREVRECYDRALQFLAVSQGEAGDWPESGHQGPAVTGLCLLALLASGEDPNFGPYSQHVRKGLRNIIASQDPNTGCIGPGNMYHHGFAMLALAEAYGAVDDRSLWSDGPRGISVGQSLELAVRCAITSQDQNPVGGWRYSPNARDADTSVSGAVFVGLLAARNAGIEVPDKNMERAIAYYRQMTAGDGSVGYSGIGAHGNSEARSSIASLVLAIARRKDLTEYAATLKYVKSHSHSAGGYAEYTAYYQAQALYQGDPQAWEEWNQKQIRRLRQQQQPDGSIRGQQGGPVFSTAMSVLVLAVNYRFLPIYER